MTTDDIVDRFYAIFRGRKDAIGTWEGGCIREPLTRDAFERHLTSDDPSDWIGVYPLGKNKCSWGCIDIDGKDFPLMEYGPEWEDWDRQTLMKSDQHDWDTMWELAANLVTLLEVKQVWAWCERTRNGIHVWVFPEDNLVEARTMRRALMAACKAADYSPKEVNPKQESLPADKLGNYVRLPYHGALHRMPQPDRYFVTDPKLQRSLDLTEFLDEVTFTSTEALESVAALWTPPVKQYAVDVHAGLEVESVVRLLNGLGYTIWKDGPLPGSDRSSTLSHLAHLCRESGLSADQGYAIVASADLRWGKFQPEGREDAEEQLTAIVERAYST